jgi:CubicO group peptidase (beta-lactamase class C family)
MNAPRWDILSSTMQRRDLLLGAFAAALQQRRIDQALALIGEKTTSGEVREAGLLVRHDGKDVASLKPDRVFLLASITKPMTATAVMILADRGLLRVEDPVHKYIPEFTGGDRDVITIRHLLTHTSGLPDMLPDNTELRKRHAPLSDFVAGVCKTPLLFKPGTEVRYQSMGILLAAEIVERVAHTRLREFLRRELFEPAGMKSTSLGLGGRKIADTAQSQVENPGDDWNWNGSYWRDLGVPWGGAHSTAADVTRLLELFLHPDGRVLKPETARAMIVNQTQLPSPWGLGWMIKPGTFGKKCSPATFGHYGSTGTVAWADPKSNLTCVLLTTKPASQSRDGLLGPVSDLVAESVS